ncbi:hypothetical protein DLREEDagrD3_22430 [Denitratisoma sp. agr-D3]
MITGGSGLLALNWACALRQRCRITLGVHRHDVRLAGVDSLRLRLDDAQSFSSQLRELAPDLVVHAAGLTRVDLCEQDPAAAKFANAEIARIVAQCVHSQGIRLLHISTDHLFSGQQSMYSETALPQPLNEYGRSKLLAEQWVAQACPHALILRTNFFGWGLSSRQSFSDWVIYGLREGLPLSMFTDVYFTPILADALALSAHKLASSDASGLFNLVGSERISKYEFGLRLARAFDLPQDLVQPSHVAQARLKAQRPPDMSLDNHRFLDRLGEPLGNLEDWFEVLREQERLGRREELLSAVEEARAG